MFCQLRGSNQAQAMRPLMSPGAQPVCIAFLPLSYIYICMQPQLSVLDLHSETGRAMVC